MLFKDAPLELERKTAVSPFPKEALVFTCLQCKFFKNTVGKGKIARNEQFFLFPMFSIHL